MYVLVLYVLMRDTLHIARFFAMQQFKILFLLGEFELMDLTTPFAGFSFSSPTRAHSLRLASVNEKLVWCAFPYPFCCRPRKSTALCARRSTIPMQIDRLSIFGPVSLYLPRPLMRNAFSPGTALSIHLIHLPLLAYHVELCKF